MENIRKYTPNYEYRYTTHYLVCDRSGNILCNAGQSKRDAFKDAEIFDRYNRKAAPHSVYRYSGGGGISRLDN